MGGVAVLAFGLTLRLYHLTILPVFADEAIYIRWAQVMRAEPTLRFLPLSDGKQPLFMWLVIPFLKLFSDLLFAGRFVSVLAGMGTLIGIFLLSLVLFKNKKAALLAGFFYAISPFSFFFDRMALADALLSMFGVWTLFLGVVIAKTLRLDFAMLAGFALGGALLTKSPAIFFAILLPTAVIFIKKPIHLIKLAGLFAVTYLIAYALYNILRLGPNFQMIGARNADYIFPISHLWLNPKDPFIFLIDRSFEWIWAMGPALVLILAAGGIVINFRKYKREILLLVSYFLFPILVQSEFARVYTARYIVFTLPYLFVLAAAVFLTSSKLIKQAAVVILGLSVLLAAKFNYLLLTNPAKANLPRSERSGYLEEWTAGQGIKEAADYLKTAGGRIVVGTEGFFGTLPDGLQMYLNDRPEITVIGVGIDIKEIPTSLVESKKAGNRTYLLVNKSRFHGDPDKLGLKLIADYPKAPRLAKDTREYIQKGPQEFLYFFELK